jgi:hypothetical protein
VVPASDDRFEEEIMPAIPFAIDHWAVSGYYTLTPEEQAALQAAVERLGDRPEQAWTADGVIPLASPQGSARRS